MNTFYVIGTHQDITSNFPQVLRFATENVKEMFERLQEVLKEYDDYTLKVFVNKMESGKIYSIADYLPGSGRSPVIYKAYMKPGSLSEWIEEPTDAFNALKEAV